MASRRMIPTRFFKDPDIMALSSKDTQLILIGLTLAADDEGREVAHAGLLGREMDYAPEHIECALQELEANDLLILYRVGKHRYYFLTRWNEWQTLGTKKRPSKYPAPPTVGTVDDERQAEKSEGEGCQIMPENASIAPAFCGQVPASFRKHPSQGNRTESKQTEEEKEAYPTLENTDQREQQKIIPFPGLSADATLDALSEEKQEYAPLVSQVAHILKLDSSEALSRLVTEYACCSSLSLLGEADAAREWIDDGTRNRRDKHMTVAFFRRWLRREQEGIERRYTIREQQATSTLSALATGTSGPTDAWRGGSSQNAKQRLPSLMHLADTDQHAKGVHC